MKTKSNYKKDKSWYDNNVKLILVTVFFLPIGVYGFYKRFSQWINESGVEKENVPRLWNVPLYDYNLGKINNKNIKSVEEGSVAGYVGFLCVVSLFIYYWVVDYGKDGVMDIVIDGERTTNSDKLIQAIQWVFYYFPHGIVNFIFDFILYGFISCLVGGAIALFLNSIFKRLF